MAKADVPLIVRENERRQKIEDDAVKASDPSLKVKIDGKVATFTGSGFNTRRQSVMLHFGDGTQSRVGTVDGKLASAVHDYPVGEFEAWAEDTRSTDREPLAKRRVNIEEAI